MEIKFNHQDIIVREYTSGRKAIGMFSFNYFCYFGKSFDDCDGLRQYGTYNIGVHKYRFATYAEVKDIISILENDVSITNDRLIKICKSYNNNMRKYKLLKLKNSEYTR